jgi:hypothetical protein
MRNRFWGDTGTRIESGLKKHFPQKGMPNQAIEATLQ